MRTPSPTRRWRALALAVLALGTMAVPSLLGTGPAAAEPSTPVIRDDVGAPDPAGCRVIDFQTATVDPLVSPDPANTTYRLTVTGLLLAPADVTLVPLTYVRQPEHWEIEVTACKVSPTAAPSLAASPPAPPFRLYRATLSFHGPLGTCGIDVVGATTHQSFDLAGPPGCERFGDHS